MASHGSNVVDRPLIFAKLGGLVKSQIIHGHRLRCRFKWNSVPTKHSCDLEVALIFEYGNQDEISGGQWHWQQRLPFSLSKSDRTCKALPQQTPQLAGLFDPRVHFGDQFLVLDPPV